MAVPRTRDLLKRVNLRIVPDHCKCLSSKCVAYLLGGRKPTAEGRVVVGDFVYAQTEIGGNSNRAFPFHSFGKHLIVGSTHGFTKRAENIKLTVIEESTEGVDAVDEAPEDAEL